MYYIELFVWFVIASLIVTDPLFIQKMYLSMRILWHNVRCTLMVSMWVEGIGSSIFQFHLWVFGWYSMNRMLSRTTELLRIKLELEKEAEELS